MDRQRKPQSARSIAETRPQLPHMANEQQPGLMDECLQLDDMLEIDSEPEMPDSAADGDDGPVDRMQTVNATAIATARRIAKKKRAKELNATARQMDAIATAVGGLTPTTPANAVRDHRYLESGRRGLLQGSTLCEGRRGV